MLSQPGVSTSHSRIPIDIRRFRWISRLAADYVHDYPRLRDFFAGNPAEPAAWRDRIARVQQYPRQRDRIADVLHAQQHRRGAPPEARAAADRLRDPKTVAIVTGQQAGLFGGPLFTLLKALTALKLAEQVRERDGVPAVAIFWVDAEDHDWDEVRRCGVFDANGSPCSIAIGNPPGAHDGPVAGVRLDAYADGQLPRWKTLDARRRCDEPMGLSPFGTNRAGHAMMSGMFESWIRWIRSLSRSLRRLRRASSS